jgi:hypothetical protein
LQFYFRLGKYQAYKILSNNFFYLTRFRKYGRLYISIALALARS